MTTGRFVSASREPGAHTYRDMSIRRTQWGRNVFCRHRRGGLWCGRSCASLRIFASGARAGEGPWDATRELDWQPGKPGLKGAAGLVRRARSVTANDMLGVRAQISGFRSSGSSWHFFHASGLEPATRACCYARQGVGWGTWRARRAAGAGAWAAAGTRYCARR